MANRPTRQMMEWHLAAVMRERGINSSAELQRRLADIGIAISSQNLSRLTNPKKDGPLRMSSDLIYGLTQVLQCTVADLWVNPDHPERTYRKARPKGLTDAGTVTQLHQNTTKTSKPPRLVEDALGPDTPPYDEPDPDQ